MLAADHEQFGHSTPNEYLKLFHGYISHSIEAIYTRVGSELEELSSDTREQAWHILSYGLKLTNAWEAVCKLLLALAPRMERDGFRHEWLPYLESGVACSRQVNDSNGEAQLSLYIGRLYRLRGEFGQAHTWFVTSAELCQQLADNEGRAKALNQLAYVARLQSQFTLAKSYVEEALLLLDENDVERATSHWVLGSMAHAQLDWSQAETHHRAALQLWQDAGDQRRAAWAMQNVGDALRNAGKHDEATLFIQQAIVLLGQLHDPVNQAIARMTWGVDHLNRNEAEQGLALLTLAEAVFRQVGDQLHLGMAHNNLIIAYRMLGDWPAAIRSGQISVRLWEALGNVKFLVSTLDEIGLTHQAQGNYAEAIATFEDGLKLLETVEPDPFQKMLQEHLLLHLKEVRQLGEN